MRILYCNKYNFRFSGTEQYLFDLMDGVRDRGNAVALFSAADLPGIAANQGGRASSSKSQHGSPCQKILYAGRAIYSWQARRRLRGLIKEFHPDVAHVRNIYHHLSPSIFWELKANRIPIIYHLNDFKLLCPSYNLVSHGRSCERCRGGRFWNVISEGCYSGSKSASWVLAAEAYVHK